MMQFFMLPVAVLPETISEQYESIKIEVLMRNFQLSAAATLVLHIELTKHWFISYKHFRIQ